MTLHVAAAFLGALKPFPKIAASDWAEENVVLPTAKPARPAQVLAPPARNCRRAGRARRPCRRHDARGASRQVALSHKRDFECRDERRRADLARRARPRVRLWLHARSA